MGVLTTALPHPEPALLAARRSVGRPPRAATAADARDGRPARPLHRHDPDRVRVRRAHAGRCSTSSRSLRARSACLLLRGVRRVLPGRRPARGLRRRRTRSIHGSRAFSFLAGNSLGGILVAAVQRPVRARARRASRSSGRRSSSGGSTRRSRRARRRSAARIALGRALDQAATRSSAPSCSGVATLNLFNFMFFALFVLYATRDLGVEPATLGIVLGAASVGTLLGSFVTGASRDDSASARPSSRGCFLFPAPLILVPAAGGPHWLVLVFLFIAEFTSGVGLMLLDIMAGSIIARHRPDGAALARLGRVHGRQLRRAPARHDARRHPRCDDRRALDALDRDRRSAPRSPLAASRPRSRDCASVPEMADE